MYISHKMAKKSPNKKISNNKTEQSIVSRKAKTSSPPFNLFIVLSSLLTFLISYYIYDVLTTVPSLPEVDLNYWWGPHPVDPTPDLSIRPYEIQFSDQMVYDLKERLLHRHPFSQPLENASFTYGFNTAFLNKVLDYWQNYYDFKERENFLNQYQHFVTNVQGLDIHYMHVKPKISLRATVVPLLILHGWPGSIREFYEIIPKLTTPRSRYKFVFEVIAPSLPGHGFSQAAVRPGLSAAEIAVIMRNLMERIGHKKYYVHGRGWGSLISSHMATLFPEIILGYHTSSPVLVTHPLAFLYTFLGSFWPKLVVEPELEHHMYPLHKHLFCLLEESGYLHLQATKPDTIGLGLTDSPAGLAAYILEKFSTWTNPVNKGAEDGNLLTKYPMTHLLDNLMIYWSTNSITTSMRLYAETMNKNQLEMQLHRIPTEVPARCMIVKYDTFQAATILKLKYKNYLGHTIADRGGHFAAFERPAMIADDIFKAVKAFETFHSDKR